MARITLARWEIGRRVYSVADADGDCFVVAHGEKPALVNAYSDEC